MSYIKSTAVDFFERFNELHIAQHTKDIDKCTLISTSEGVALEIPGWLPRAARIWTTFDIAKNVKLIVDAAKDRLKQISSDDTSDKIRSISACQAASRTCFFIDKIVMRTFKPELKELHDDLQSLGLRFIERQAVHRSISCTKAACENETLGAALHFIQKGEQITEVDAKHYQPLLALCCGAGDYKIACDLIKLGAMPEQSHKTKLLFYALEQKKKDIALILVEQGADLHEQKEGKYPLHVASEAGFLEVVQKMIEKGAPLASLDLDSSTALHLACQKLHADVASALIHAGINVSQINLQVDPATNARRRGSSAMGLALHAAGDTLSFFRKLLPSYAIPDEGMQAFLNSCKKAPETVMEEHCEHNPFELALLFQDAELAESVAEKLTLSQFYEQLEALKAQYRTSSIDTLEFSFLALSDEHMLKENLDPFRLRALPKDVSLEELLTYDRSQEISVRRFLSKIQNRAPLPGLLNTDEARQKYYELLEKCIKHIIIALQNGSDEQKEHFLQLICTLEAGEASSGTYFDRLTSHYRATCKKKPNSFEEQIAFILAELREMILRSILTQINDYNEALSYLGEELAIPGHDARLLYKATKGQCDVKAVKEKFFRLYTPQAIVRNCLLPYLTACKEQFLCWMESKMPPEWGQEVSKNFSKIRTRSDAEKRAFLQRNGVVISTTDSNFEAAIEKRRKEVYREELLDEQGKIKELSVIRMLALLEKPVFISSKLGLEGSPSTFTTDAWLLDIIDMV